MPTQRQGRDRQRRRTRTAIVDAAAQLIAQGRTPSVSEIAAAADVSRRTVYLYFPTLELLLIDATLGAISQAVVDRAIEASDPEAGVEARLDAMVSALSRQAVDTLPLGRSLIRLTVETPNEPHGSTPRRGLPPRGLD